MGSNLNEPRVKVPDVTRNHHPSDLWSRLGQPGLERPYNLENRSGAVRAGLRGVRFVGDGVGIRRRPDANVDANRQRMDAEASPATASPVIHDRLRLGIPCQSLPQSAASRGGDALLRQLARCAISIWDKPGQRLAQATQAPGPQGDDPVAVAAASRWPELKMDRGLPGKPGLRLGDPRVFRSWRDAIDAAGQVALTQAGSHPARLPDLASPHVDPIVISRFPGQLPFTGGSGNFRRTIP